MARADWTSARLWATFFAIASSIALTAASPAAAEDGMQDRGRDDGMRDGRGIGLGIGIGIGIANEIIHQQGANSIGGSGRATVSKKPKRAAKKPEGDEPPQPAPKKDPVADLGPPIYIWHGFDVFSDGTVREHVGPTTTQTGNAHHPPTTKPDPKDEKCIVISAQLKFAKQTADTPLQVPRDFTAPAPGTNPADQLGPSHGLQPGSKDFFTGNVFEYHSDLNNRDGCKSEQLKLAWIMLVDKSKHQISEFLDTPDDTNLDLRVRVNGNPHSSSWKPDRIPPKKVDQRATSIFDGNTRTGPREPGPSPYYEGTPNRIHWVDAPGIKQEPNPADGRLAILVALLRSETKGTDGHGWFCLSGHTVVVDTATGQAVGLDSAKSALSSTSGKGNNKNKLAAKVANAGATDLTENPQFRNLGCYPF